MRATGRGFLAAGITFAGRCPDHLPGALPAVWRPACGGVPPARLPAAGTRHVRIRQDREGPAGRRQVGRALVRVAAGGRSAGDPCRAHGRARRHRRARARALAHIAGGGVPRRCARSAGPRGADRPVHRALIAQLAHRASALVGDVRPVAGVPAGVHGVLARHLRPRAEQQVAGAAADADRAPDRAPGTRGEDPPLPLRAVDPGQVGRAARALHARLQPSSSASRSSTRAVAPRRSSTPTWPCWSCSS